MNNTDAERLTLLRHEKYPVIFAFKCLSGKGKSTLRISTSCIQHFFLIFFYRMAYFGKHFFALEPNY